MSGHQRWPRPALDLDAVAVRLLDGAERVTFTACGRSMEPRIRDGQQVTVHRYDGQEELDTGDIVLARVKGQVYLHQIIGISGSRYLIGNNKGGVNGWAARPWIYGVYQEHSEDPAETVPGLAGPAAETAG
jgi:Peptidase S24-like